MRRKNKRFIRKTAVAVAAAQMKMEPRGAQEAVCRGGLKAQGDLSQWRNRREAGLRQTMIRMIWRRLGMSRKVRLSPAAKPKRRAPEAEHRFQREKSALHKQARM